GSHVLRSAGGSRQGGGRGPARAEAGEALHGRQAAPTRPAEEPPGRPRSSKVGVLPTFRMCSTPPQQPSKEVIMPKSKTAGVTRRQILKAGGAATFAGYAVGGAQGTRQA